MRLRPTGSILNDMAHSSIALPQIGWMTIWELVQIKSAPQIGALLDFWHAVESADYLIFARLNRNFMIQHGTAVHRLFSSLLVSPCFISSHPVPFFRDPGVTRIN